MKTSVKYEATHLRDCKWAVKPENQLGTCGFYPVPWTVQYVTANNADEALRRAGKK